MDAIKKTLRRLTVLNDEWPLGELVLYASEGMLCVLESDTWKTLKEFPAIPCGGGVPLFEEDAGVPA